MVFYIILLGVICLIGIRAGKGFDDYMDKEQTFAIRGIFAMIILFSHFQQYADLSAVFTGPLFVKFVRRIGQRMVVPFLFYSGYGIAVSSKKRQNYFDTFFRRRILHTLLYFDCSVILFLIFGIIRGRTFSLTQILLSFIGWDSLGNSNWYVFAIICLYAMTLISVKLTGNRIDLKSTILTLIFSVLYILILSKVKESWWYNTVLAYPAGMLYALYKDQILILLKKHYWFLMAAVLCGFLVTYFLSNHLFLYEMNAVLFIVLITFMTFRIKVNNPVLQFLGLYSFDIYLLQRLPASSLQGVIANPVLYLGAAIALTLMLAVCFHKICTQLLKPLQ